MGENNSYFIILSIASLFKKYEEMGGKAILMLEQVIWFYSEYQSSDLLRFFSRIIYLY